MGIECTGCDAVFESKFAMHKHFRTKHSEVKFGCQKCLLKFKYADTLEQHISDGKQFQCAYEKNLHEEFQLMNQSAIQRQYEKNVIEQPLHYHCHICGASFQWEGDYQTHFDSRTRFCKGHPAWQLVKKREKERKKVGVFILFFRMRGEPSDAYRENIEHSLLTTPLTE